MKILVYDVAAEYGGALTILKMVYDYAAKDTINDWVFVVSNSNLLEIKFEHISVLEYKEPKKSWLHRLYFDRFTMPKLLKKVNPTLILNLQNIMLKTNIKQYLYMHQAIPFCSRKFSMIDFKLWIYQNLIGKLIYKSIKKCDKTIVQTNWLKHEIVNKKLNNERNIIVKPVEFNIQNIVKYNKFEYFLYPAGAAKFKNHYILIKSWIMLNQKYGINPKLVLTLKGNENTSIKKLKKLSDKHGLNILWIGKIDRDELLNLYSKSILVFPSYLESFGLPLLEAKLSGCPIIASNTSFSHDILDDYNNVFFFNYNSKEELSNIVLDYYDKYK